MYIENEDIKLGRGIGWYTGIVHNTFKFKDIGRSKEQMLQVKVGLLKSVPLMIIIAWIGQYQEIFL